MKSITMTSEQYTDYCQQIAQGRDRWEVVQSILNLDTDNFIIQSAILTDENRVSLDTLIVTVLE